MSISWKAIRTGRSLPAPSITAPIPERTQLPDHKTRSVFRADSTPGGGGFNELHFENKKGSEVVYLQAQKDYNVLVKNNKGQTIGNNSDTNVINTLTETAKEIIITASSSITLVCGGSTIVLPPQTRVMLELAVMMISLAVSVRVLITFVSLLFPIVCPLLFFYEDVPVLFTLQIYYFATFLFSK